MRSEHRDINPNPYEGHQGRRVDPAGAYDSPGSERHGGRSEGRIVQVTFNGAGSALIPVVANQFAMTAPPQDGGTSGNRRGDPRVWEVLLECQVPAAGTFPQGSAIYYQMRYWVGDAAFQTPLKWVDPSQFGRPNRRVVLASAVQVQLYGLGANGPAQPVSVAIGENATFTDAAQFDWQYATPFTAASGQKGNITDGASAITTPPGNKFLQGGCIAQAHIILIGLGGGSGPLWGCFYDVNDVTNLTTGTAPIRGAVLDQVSAAGDGRSFGDEFSPGDMNFHNGLVFALSTSPDTFQAPAGTPTCHVDVKVGV